MSPAMFLGLVVAGLVGVPALGVLGMWWHARRQDARCQRAQHDWGRWHVRAQGTPTVLGPMDLLVSYCQRGCGAHVRRMAGIGYGEGNAPGLAEKLFREARS